MSLIADVSVNRFITVGTVGIQRIAGGTNPDDINTYEYTIYNNDRNTGVSEILAKGRLTHRYGDSGLLLLHKVLDDAKDLL